jgi:hypothetical protein
MTELEQFKAIINNIIDAHSSSVHQLLIAKGITKKATPEVLLDVYKIYGSPFISELVDIVYSKQEKNVSNYDTAIQIIPKTTTTPLTTTPTTGTAQTTFTASVTSGTEKKTFWDNLSNIFNSAANLGTATSSVISSIKTTSGSVGNTIQSLINPTVVEEKSAGNTMLIIGIVIVVILLLIVFTTRKQ